MPWQLGGIYAFFHTPAGWAEEHMSQSDGKLLKAERTGHSGYRYSKSEITITREITTYVKAPLVISVGFVPNGMENR